MTSPSSPTKEAEEGNIPPPKATTPFDESPPAAKKQLADEGDDKTNGTAKHGLSNSCGDCFNAVQEPVNQFFTSLIFPPSTTNPAEDKVEVSLSKQAVDIVPMASILDKNLSTPTVCSFASTLTSKSSDSNDEYTPSMKDAVGRRLTPEERKQAFATCRALRMQISTFEENFTKEHGRMPSSSRDKAPLVDIYTQYREGKRRIRVDAACRIQALCRGAIVRMRATKKSTEARVDALLENADLDDASLLTTEMIAKYLSPEERKKIATKILSQKLYHHKDELSLAVPENAKGDEYMCKVCEMPKLSNKDGEILDECIVCPALNKKIIQRKKDEKKSSQLMSMEKKKLAYEKEKLQKMKEQMEEERKRITLQEDAEKKEGAADKLKETKAALLGSSTAYTGGRSATHSTSLEVRAKKRLEEMEAEQAEKAKKVSVEGKKEYGFGEESFSNIINNLRADLKNITTATTTTPEAVEVVTDSQKKDAETEEEKDEFDDLLEDPDITHAQRKIRGCPSPHPSEGATAPDDYVSKHRHGKIDDATDKNDDKSYGGFATKEEYDKFQEAFVEFERDHKDIIDYMRKKVAHKGRGRGERSSRARSSSVPSFSSDDSREYERRRRKERDTYRDRHSRRYRHHEDYKIRGGRHHQRAHHDYYDEDYDSESTEFSYPDYERRHYSSRPSRRTYRGRYERDHRDHRHARHRYYKDSHEYEPRRRGYGRPTDSFRRRGKHYDDYSSNSSDSGEYFSDSDRFVNQSRRHAKEEGMPKPFSKPLGLN